MKVSLTQYRRCAYDANGNPLPIGGDKITSQVITAAGAFTALDASCQFVRIATDTAIQVETTGGAAGANSELFPANSAEFFAVVPGSTLNAALA